MFLVLSFILFSLLRFITFSVSFCSSFFSFITSLLPPHSVTLAITNLLRASVPSLWLLVSFYSSFLSLPPTLFYSLLSSSFLPSLLHTCLFHSSSAIPTVTNLFFSSRFPLFTSHPTFNLYSSLPLLFPSSSSFSLSCTLNFIFSPFPLQQRILLFFP